jgi:hypothetical protein
MKGAISIAAVMSASVTLTGCPPPQATVANSNPVSAPIRGKIIDAGGSLGRFRYDYYDGYEPDSDVGYLQSLGYQGGGPSWAGIVFGLLKLRTPATIGRVQFDEEGEGLAVWSDDREALETIGRLVAEAKTHRDLLRAAIDLAKQERRME